MTSEQRCSRCDMPRIAHSPPNRCPGFYVAPKPPVEPDKLERVCAECGHYLACTCEPRSERERPHRLTLTRADGSTVEVRTRRKWYVDGDDVHLTEPDPDAETAVVGTLIGVSFLSAARFAIYDDDWSAGIEWWVALADDLRAIRTALHPTTEGGE